RLVAVGERARFLVRTAHRAPRRGGVAPTPGHLQRERLGAGGRRDREAAGAVAPERELAEQPRMAFRRGEVECASGLARRALVVAGDPRRFGARRADRAEAL